MIQPVGSSRKRLLNQHLPNQHLKVLVHQFDHAGEHF